MKSLLNLTCIAGFLIGSTCLLAEDITPPRIIDSSTTWTADNTYILDGKTFVVTPEGASEPTMLTIQPGTVIMGTQSTGADASALVITRGAKIHAEGSVTNPIIFTSELDDLNGNLGPDDAGLWGGLIVMGNASISSRADKEIVAEPIEDQIEGIEVSNDEIELATFGGTDDEDDSGVIKYVSIRHGGAVVGADNEINGLTLGGVGSDTTVEYVEVFANKDDGIEWFGGTVNVRYAAIAFGKDDSFDYDQGWRGYGQFWFSIGNDSGFDRMDKGGEHDGATAPLDAEPLQNSTVFNATFIGIGDSTDPDGNAGRDNTALNIRDNASARYYNSVFLDFAKMLDIEDDNLDRFNAGDVDFRNNIWWSHISANNTASGLNGRPDGDVNPEVFWTDASYENTIENPELRSVSRAADAALDPRPASGSPALSGPVQDAADEWFVQTDYKGAFSPDSNWLIGWTKLSQEGYLAKSPSWVLTDTLGWVYAFSGSVAPGNWLWIPGLGHYGYTISETPSQMFISVWK